MKRLLATIVIALWAGVTVADDSVLPPGMAGQWNGSGREIMTWSDQETVVFALNILPDGRVEGTVGDATIRAGSIGKNALLLRLLGNSEYVIDAALDGPIVAREHIRRESIKILLSFRKDGFRGSFHTSGTKDWGGKESMRMSGVDVRLERR